MSAALTPAYLFGRAYGVFIGRIGSDTTAFYGNFSPQQSILGGGPFQESPLRVAFEIEKQTKSTSNKAKISIYNLSNDSRSRFPKGGYAILLYAGYQSLNELIYFGDVSYVASERKGSEVVTLFECGEAERVLTYGTFKRPYPSRTSVVQIVSDVVESLMAQGVTASSIVWNALKVGGGTLFPVKVYNKGVSFNSTIRDVLDTVLPPLNLKWFIQNNIFEVQSLTGIPGAPVVASLISQNTGMIGVPSQGANGMVKFRSLLNSNLMPGEYVQIQSQTVNGNFRITKSTFQGDSHDQKWEVECEAFVAVEAFQEQNAVNAGFITNTSGFA